MSKTTPDETPSRIPHHIKQLKLPGLGPGARTVILEGSERPDANEIKQITVAGLFVRSHSLPSGKVTVVSTSREAANTRPSMSYLLRHSKTIPTARQGGLATVGAM